jgi:hypothetical protein
MIPFTLGQHKFELPQDYGEITLKQFFDLRASGGTLIEVLGIMSGLGKEVWEQCKDIDLDYKIAPYLEFLYEPFQDTKYILADRLQINGEYYDRPKTLGIETLGQKLAFQQEYDRIVLEGKSEFDIYPYALALYFQPAYTNDKFNLDKVEKILPDIMNCRIEEAFPIAAFFLSNYAKYRKRKKPDYLIPLHQKKYEQALIVSKSSDRLEQFTPYRRVWVKITRKFYSWSMMLFTKRSGMKVNKTSFKRS